MFSGNIFRIYFLSRLKFQSKYKQNYTWEYYRKNVAGACIFFRTDDVNTNIYFNFIIFPPGITMILHNLTNIPKLLFTENEELRVIIKEQENYYSYY